MGYRAPFVAAVSVLTVLLVAGSRTSWAQCVPSCGPAQLGRVGTLGPQGPGADLTRSPAERTAGPESGAIPDAEVARIQQQLAQLRQEITEAPATQDTTMLRQLYRQLQAQVQARREASSLAQGARASTSPALNFSSMDGTVTPPVVL